jgi:hypothetical protein
VMQSLSHADSAISGTAAPHGWLQWDHRSDETPLHLA